MFIKTLSPASVLVFKQNPATKQQNKYTQNTLCV